MIRDEEIITRKFNGDANKYDFAVAEAIDNSINWSDLELSYKIHPNLEEKIIELIGKRLGYLPRNSKTLFYEVDLRVIYHDYQFGKICEHDFYNKADTLIKLMRNDDMERDVLKFEDPNLYEIYKENYLPFIQRARERISYFLGYEPELKCSMVAEMWMGQVLSIDNYRMPDRISPLDFQAMTSIKYREVLLSKGKEAADKSPLLAMQSIN